MRRLIIDFFLEVNERILFTFPLFFKSCFSLPGSSGQPFYNFFKSSDPYDMIREAECSASVCNHNNPHNLVPSFSLIVLIGFLICTLLDIFPDPLKFSSCSPRPRRLFPPSLDLSLEEDHLGRAKYLQPRFCPTPTHPSAPKFCPFRHFVCPPQRAYKFLSFSHVSFPPFVREARPSFLASAVFD